MPKVRAPHGGLYIAGHYYKGGKFIPSSVMAQARSESGLEGPDRKALLKTLAAHKHNADPEHTDRFRRLHDLLKDKYGDNTHKRLDAEAKALKDAHDKTKDPGHKAHLSMRLGSMHAAMDDGSDSSPAPPSAGSTPGVHAPIEVSTKEPEQAGNTITVMKEKGGYTAYIGKPGEEEAGGATAEEAVGRLVMENADKLGIKIAGDKKVDAAKPDMP